MRFNFKKISAIASSVLLVGMTMGVAAAANYPAPFVSGSNADVAIVYGTGTGVSTLDQMYAGDISDDLLAGVTGVTTSVSGGESLSLGGKDDEFYFGNALNSVYDDPLDDGDLEDFLEDGEYDDGSIDEEFSQVITLGTQVLTLFSNRDYKDEEPTLGFEYDNDDVLSYTITFDDPINYSETEGTNMPLIGNEYYVLDATDPDELILLDSAQETLIREGETITIDGKSVEISYITADSVKFIVDKETTDKLYDDAANGDKYYELDDESFLVLNENLYEPKETGISKAQFSIGKGKITLFADGSEIEVNDKEVEGMTSTFTVNGGELEDITIDWEIDDKEFLVEGTALTMPIFETISLAFNGFNFPSDPEMISLDNGDELTLTMDNFDIELMFSEDGETVTQGGDGYLLIIDANKAASKTYYVVDDDRILAAFINEDLSDVEMAYYQIGSMSNTSDGFDLNLDNLIDSSDDISFDNDDAGDEEELTSDITVTLNAVYDVSDDILYNATLHSDFVAHFTNDTEGEGLLEYDVANITVSHDDGDDLNFDKVVSEKGLIAVIPAAANMSANTLTVEFYEADEDGDLDYLIAGTPIAIDLAWDDDDDVIYATKDGVTFEEESEDNFYGYVESPLATKVMVDTNDNALDMEYYGDTVSADVQIIVGGEVSTTGLGSIVIRDSEVSSMSNKNLIIVGGSCINAVAANLVGGAYCGAAFTSATSVGSGQYIVKSYDNPYDDGTKVALLVAGYEVADTEAAKNYVITQEFDAETIDMVKATATVI